MLGYAPQIKTDSLGTDWVNKIINLLTTLTKKYKLTRLSTVVAAEHTPRIVEIGV